MRFEGDGFVIVQPYEETYITGIKLILLKWAR